MEHLDRIDVAAELVGDDLGPRRLVALAVRRGTGDDLDRAGRQVADRGLLPPARRVPDRAEDPGGREAAHLVVRREADAELLRALVVAALRLLRAEGVQVEQLEELVERRAVV